MTAIARIIQRELANIPPPVCLHFAYGKAHQKLWRYRRAKDRHCIEQACFPRQVVIIDLLVYATDDLVSTYEGIPTNKCYRGTTIFVDHFSNFTYTHLMTKVNTDAMVETKLAFK